tara:strand:- start:1643 stop:1981 length:339 start_codon:yes stop_codon:yes gene_type:complete
MPKLKFLISAFMFISFLIITSTIKNETRIIEKKILGLKFEISSKKENINEAQLDYYYLASPSEVEKRLYLIGFDEYKPIVYSKIFLNLSDFTNLEKKISSLKKINEKKNKKK